MEVNEMTLIHGVVRNTLGEVLEDVALAFVNKDTGKAVMFKSQAEGAYAADVTPGRYVWVAVEDGYSFESAEVVVPAAESTEGPIIVLEQTVEGASPPSGSPPIEPTDIIEEFIEQLGEPRFAIEAPISILEARQAVGLFSVVNILLGGSGERTVGAELLTDVLGILNLYYGLQDKSLTARLVVQNSDRLWRSVEKELKQLAKQLDQLQADVGFLEREAKRQFNLGTTNTVLGNTQFPTLFNRYVELGTDPLVSIDIKVEKGNKFFDKTKLEETYDLLRELKITILQMVRSLSKFGTAATRRVNEDWIDFESRALEVLYTVAEERVSEDLDEQTAWSTLAVLIDQNREAIIPYVALAKHGTMLLDYTVDIYRETQNQLDNFDELHLEELFQPQGKEYWTTRIRRQASVLKRYPLPNWG
jgi:hypothetical protein